MPEPENPRANVGIDVSKNTLDIAVHETGETWSSPNDSHGCATVAAKLKLLKATSIVLEATGGFETLVTATLSAADLPVIVVILVKYETLPKPPANWPKQIESTAVYWRTLPRLSIHRYGRSNLLRPDIWRPYSPVGGR